MKYPSIYAPSENSLSSGANIFAKKKKKDALFKVLEREGEGTEGKEGSEGGRKGMLIVII